MAKYKMALTAFGLSQGDTFESDDPGWEDRVKAGFVSVVDDTVELSVVSNDPTLFEDTEEDEDDGQ